MEVLVDMDAGGGGYFSAAFVCCVECSGKGVQSAVSHEGTRVVAGGHSHEQRGSPITRSCLDRRIGCVKCW